MKKSHNPIAKDLRTSKYRKRIVQIAKHKLLRGKQALKNEEEKNG